MTEKKDAAEAMRQSASRLRAVATDVETKLSAELLRIAQSLENDADETEARNGGKRSDGDGAIAP